jgi:hypothetical protein
LTANPEPLIVIRNRNIGSVVPLAKFEVVIRSERADHLIEVMLGAIEIEVDKTPHGEPHHPIPGVVIHNDKPAFGEHFALLQHPGNRKKLASVGRWEGGLLQGNEGIGVVRSDLHIVEVHDTARLNGSYSF